MPKSVVRALHSFKQRHALSGDVIRLLESFRDSYFPGVTTPESFTLLLLLHKIADRHELGRTANASALAWSTGIPRGTVLRRLAQLKNIGAVEQCGSRFSLSVRYMNDPRILAGFARRRRIVRHLFEELSS